MSFQPSITIGANTYLALPQPGSYINGATTVDEPILFDLQSSPQADGTSSFVVKLRRYKNSSTAGAKDLILQTHTVVKWDTKSFSLAEVEAHEVLVHAFFTTANIAKIARGEL